MSKQGSTSSGAMVAFSIAMSVGLQTGAPLEAYVSKFTQHALRAERRLPTYIDRPGDEANLGEWVPHARAALVANCGRRGMVHQPGQHRATKYFRLDQSADWLEPPRSSTTMSAASTR